MSRVVKWRANAKGQWHFGVVTDAEPNEYGVQVEYTHSTPPSNIPAGRLVRMDAWRLKDV